MKWLLIFFYICLWPSMLLADEEITILEVQGFGGTQSEAVQNGLIEALKQAKGVNIESEKEYVKKLRETSLSTDNSSSYNLKIDEDSQSTVREATQGLIREYRITESSPTDHSEWAVKLAVKLVRYKTPGFSPHERRKIAVIPFRSTKQYFTFHGVDMPYPEISRQFSQKMVIELAQSRRFTVLDREYMEEFLREKNLILSSDIPVSELMKIGEALGVDYLLIGTISEASEKQTSYFIQVTGETGYEHSASFFADYRIVVMATRQIKWADSVSLTFDDAKIKDMVPSLEAVQIKTLLFESAAKKVVHRAMENIYPLRVVKVQANGEVILNQGGVSLADRDMLDVFSAGEQVVDPYTGEALGPAESWIATIEIVRVIPKMSFAKVIKGDSGSIPNGSICRRITNEKSLLQRPSGRVTNIISSPSGGVYLPFDN